MNIVPLTVEDALAFLKKHERHYKQDFPPAFAIGLADENELRGAVVVGYVNTELGYKSSIQHIYSDGEFQGYTLLYGSAVRAAKALGYKEMIL